MCAWFFALLFVPAQDFSITKGQSFVIDTKQVLTTETVLPAMLDVPVKYNRMADNSILADILNRTDWPSLGNGRSTDGHESTHRLNAQLRNENGGAAAVALYVLNGKALYCKEPAFRKSAVAVFIPASLRDSKFRLYVTGSDGWDDKPSYIAEEWSAYINDLLINIEDRAAGYRTDQSDCATGALEMGICSIALCMAVEKYAPESWAENASFKASMKYQWKRAKEAYDKGAPLWPNEKQNTLLHNLRNSPDAEAMRQFINTHFDGLWLKP